MPEGDTVFRTARTLDQALHGELLTGCDLRVPAFATVDLAGERMLEVASRGKHLLMRVGEASIHSHLKMEGAWHLYRHGSRWRRPAFQARAVLETADWVAVGFDLGLLEVLPLAREAERLAWLGPDLLGADWDSDEAVRRIRSAPERPIAVALADQGNLAGLGNEYVNEVCFLRGLLPTRPVGEVADVPGLVELAHRLITANRDRAERTTTGITHRGAHSWVFARAGQPCRRCGTPIERGSLGRNALELRNTFWCPRCQT
ncbi:DNA-formamidopyrimidine glycosylase family protein [Cryobacterium tagatosivorans]|uniref:DNA-(apurinic or apyrimidinic site) lyase n=1 Tax=Cryobacterium tagatosivorans TaxID=1259199 RepID=A0A4R8UJV6_9MICO|nr:DNA-formamidopyrimidine glycosylase family protein [Cryobacterium tagatosivorans]TFB56019.1 Fpg/Nei family DNA glycosylase [Cryobacterium tagatosivorans]